MRFAITLRNALFALAALVACAGPARAQAELYAARHVPVEVTAESAAQARDQAIAEGQRRALEIVLRRLVSDEAYARLPKLGDAEVARLVDGFLVEKEKASARRYIAELTVEFRPAAVQELLRGSGLAFVEQRARPLLVLPVLDEDGRLTLFDDPNPWREAWAKAAQGRSGLVPIVLPLGDLQDVAELSPEQAIAGDDQRMSAMAQRYGASRWAVAVARPAADGVNLTLQRASGSEVETVRPEAGEGPDALLAKAAGRLAGRLDEEWKRSATAVAATGPEARLSATAPLAGFADWLALRERLSRTSAVRRVEVLGISTRDAQVVLHHVGSPDQLVQALALQDVELTAGELGFWRLAVRGGPQAGR